jgi:uncharacterized lipoprotein YehR (DUF1307 family)
MAELEQKILDLISERIKNLKKSNYSIKFMDSYNLEQTRVEYKKLKS